MNELNTRRLQAYALLLCPALAVAQTPAAQTTTATPDSDAVELEEVHITASGSEALTRFGARAAADTVTDVVSEATLRNPNAQTTADYIKDVSGVSVSKGANGTSTVSMRGIDQRLLKVTVDGQRQGGSGNALDAIPAEIVQSMEVTKTFTPDMEADAVGGVISINTGGTVLRAATLQGRHQLAWNTLAPHAGTRNSLTAGRPFSLHSDADNASVLATVGFNDLYAKRERISDLREWTAQVSPGPAPYTGQLLPTLTLPLLENTREHPQRSNAVLNADARFGESTLYWRSNWTHDWTRRSRAYVDTNPAAGVIRSLTPTSGSFSQVTLSRRSQLQENVRDALTASLGGKVVLARAELDAQLGYTRTHEREPDTLDAGFLSDHRYRVSYDISDPFRPQFTELDETVSGDSTSRLDPARYHFNYLYETRSDSDEQDGSLKWNLKLPLAAMGDYLKFGGKLQQRHVRADADRDVWAAGPAALPLSGLTTLAAPLQTLDYSFDPVPDAAAVRGRVLAQPLGFTRDATQTAINTVAGDWTTREDLWALYGMGRKRLESGLVVLGGVRVEGTTLHARANPMRLDAAGALAGFDVANAAVSYVEVLPGLHLRYEPAQGLLYRASITRSMSRPGSADLAPYRTLSFFDHRGRAGTPTLQPYLATNVDLSVDRYTEHSGLLSAAVFYKKIDHFIADTQQPEQVGNLGTFIIFRRINGDAAWSSGLELSWQSPNLTLPAGLGRGALTVNYSFNHGEAHQPMRPGEVFPLPRQVAHQASTHFTVTRGALTLDANVSYRSGWWEDLIARDLDNFITSAWDAELSGSVAFGKSGRVTFGASNLLNRPTRHYAGTPARFNDWQLNGIDYTAGVQWKL